MSDYILGIDQGTTSSKVIIMDRNLNLIAEQATPFEQYFPSPGLVEHDLNQIWKSIQAGIDSVVKKVDAKKILSIGITNQRETICFWDKKTGEPLSKAIVWQDRRTAARCEELKKQGLEESIRKKTGLLLDPYFSSTKIEWSLKNIPEIKKSAAAGALAFGTIESFVLSKLSGGKAHATEGSNASRTMLFDLEKKSWDPELLKLFGVDSNILPEVLPNFGVFGKTEGVQGLPDGIPITGMIGDQQSALLGQACIETGQAKCTYGTGAFLLMNTGAKLKRSQFRLLSTVAWINQKGEATYALEGSAFMAGATIQWLRDGLKMIQSSAEIEPLAKEVESTEGVMFVPAFTGLGAPHWNPLAKASISGLTRGSTRAHIARAALEGIAFQNVDILRAMEKDLDGEIQELSVDGGACKNNLLMQIQSDLLGRKIKRPVFTETTILGAIFASGIGAGVWSSPSDVKKVWKLEKEFNPKISSLERDQRFQEWREAVRRID